MRQIKQTQLPVGARFALCLGLALVVLAAFWPVHCCEFVNFDDPEYVIDNPMVQQGFTAETIKWAFYSGYASNWHPLTWLSHMLDCQLFGLHPAGHHDINLLFHLANTLLLFGLFQKMTGALWRSAFVASLFALHPLHVESVAWISERKDVLSAFFGLLSLWAYVCYAQKLEVRGHKVESGRRSFPFCLLPSKFYLLSLAFFSCSLMSKPMLVTLPFLLLLFDYWPLCRTPSAFSLQPSALLEKAPFFALSFASSLVTFIVQKNAGSVSDFAVLPLDVRLGNVLISYLRYLQKTIWPCDLAAFYPFRSGLLWQIVCSGLLLIAISFLLLRNARQRPYLAIGWLWFVGALTPVIGLVQVGNQGMADRYSYFPLIGIFIIVSWSVYDVFLKYRSSRLFLAGLAGCALICLADATSFQISCWQDGISLFKHAVAVTPSNAVAENTLGNALLRKMEIAQAKFHFLAALRLAPDFPDANYQFGVVLMRQGETSQAIAYWRRALELKPNWPELMNNLAWVLATHPDANFRNGCESVRLAESACRARAPTSAAFLDTLAAAYAEAGRFDDAIRTAQKAAAMTGNGDGEPAAQFRQRLQLYQSGQPYRASK